MNLQLNLQPKQLEAAKFWIDKTTQEILYGGAKGGGKSYLGAALIFSDALLYPGTHYFIARHNLNDLKKYTTPTIYEVLKKMGVDYSHYVTFNGQDNYFELYNNSRVYYIDCRYLPSDPDFHRFGSLQFTRGWFEEVGQINNKAIENLGVAVGRWLNNEYGLTRKILYTCNPNKGFAYSEFYLKHKKNELPEYRKFITALPTENKYLPAEYIEALERLQGAQKERLRFGNWEYDDDPTRLISDTSINNLFSNTFVKASGRFFIVADVARFGADSSIITVWDGLRLVDYVRLDTSKTTKVVNIINSYRTKYGVQLSNILVDEDGVGGGVVDMLGCYGFVANSKPDNPNYKNLKAECGYKLGEVVDDIWIKAELESNDKEKIIQELAYLKAYDIDKDMKLQILPKTKIKEKLGRSPDWLDIFIMRMYFEIFITQYAIQ